MLCSSSEFIRHFCRQIKFFVFCNTINLFYWILALFLNNKHRKKLLDHHCCLNFKDNLLNFKIPCTFRKFLQLHTYSLTFFCGKKWTSIYRCTHRFNVLILYFSLYYYNKYILYTYIHMSHIPKDIFTNSPKKVKKKTLLIEWAFCIPPPVLAFSIPLNCF